MKNRPISSTALLEEESRNRKEKERLAQKAAQRQATKEAQKRDRFARTISLISLGVSFAALVLSFLFGMGILP